MNNLSKNILNELIFVWLIVCFWNACTSSRFMFLSKKVKIRHILLPIFKIEEEKNEQQHEDSARSEQGDGDKTVKVLVNTAEPENSQSESDGLERKNELMDEGENDVKTGENVEILELIEVSTWLNLL